MNKKKRIFTIIQVGSIDDIPMKRFVKCYFCLLTQVCSCRRLEAGFGGGWYKTLAAPKTGL